MAGVVQGAIAVTGLVYAVLEIIDKAYKIEQQEYERVKRNAKDYQERIEREQRKKINKDQAYTQTLYDMGLITQVAFADLKNKNPGWVVC